MNKSLLKNVSLIACGISIGAAAVWIFEEKRYKKLLREEIDSVKEAYNRKAKELADINAISKENMDLSDKHDEEIETEEVEEKNSESIISDYVSTSLDSYSKEEILNDLDAAIFKEVVPTAEKAEPEIIDISEFGEELGYTQITLYYYINNDILTDDKEEEISEPELVIGEKALNELSNNEYINELYLKDDQRGVYYEILINENDFDLEAQANKY